MLEQNEIQWDKLLKIKTSGRDDSNADQFRYPYEPTPYCVLERLAGSGLIGKKNVLMDYGCGKGRVGFFMSYQTRCRSIGIEYDVRLYEMAKANQVNAVSGRRTEIILANAEEYKVPAEVDTVFFFNPFSVEILKKVLARLLESYYENPRTIRLFFYYISHDYVGYLMTQDMVQFTDEIGCADLFKGNSSQERIMIFEIG